MPSFALLALVSKKLPILLARIASLDSVFAWCCLLSVFNILSAVCCCCIFLSLLDSCVFTFVAADIMPSFALLALVSKKLTILLARVVSLDVVCFAGAFIAMGLGLTMACCCTSLSSLDCCAGVFVALRLSMATCCCTSLSSLDCCAGVFVALRLSMATCCCTSLSSLDCCTGVCVAMGLSSGAFVLKASLTAFNAEFKSSFI